MRISLTKFQVDLIRQMACREQLRWESVLKILVASKTRDLWEDEKKCLPRFLQKFAQTILAKYIPQCEQNVKNYRDVADAFSAE